MMLQLWSTHPHLFTMMLHNGKVGTHLRQGNTKLRLYEAAFARLVWSAHVYHTPSTNRNKPCSLSHFVLSTTIGLVCATHEAIASGRCCMVHTTRQRQPILLLQKNNVITAKIIIFKNERFKVFQDVKNGCSMINLIMTQLPPGV